ncbi:MAG: T9SS type A sorting domain-containing protein, partial [Actinomycetia bacterium]|nr:T9SS type A sorting domain-containing protein [Actinomycetes bacterium]
ILNSGDDLYIYLDLTASSSVTVDIFSISGRKLTSFLTGTYSAGRSGPFTFNTLEYIPGVYTAVLTVDNKRISKKFAIVR